MTQKQYKRELLREIRKVNEAIDFKVVFGQRYDREALRHRLLMERMEKLRKQSLLSRIQRAIMPFTLF